MLTFVSFVHNVIVDTRIYTVQGGEHSLDLSSSSSEAYIMSPNYPGYSSINLTAAVRLLVPEGAAFLLSIHHAWIAKTAGQCSDRLVFIRNNVPSEGCCGNVYDQTDPDAQSCNQIQNIQMNDLWIQWKSFSRPDNGESIGFLIEITGIVFERFYG